MRSMLVGTGNSNTKVNGPDAPARDFHSQPCPARNPAGALPFSVGGHARMIAPCSNVSIFGLGVGVGDGVGEGVSLPATCGNAVCAAAGAVVAAAAAVGVALDAACTAGCCLAQATSASATIRAAQALRTAGKAFSRPHK